MNFFENQCVIDGRLLAWGELTFDKPGWIVRSSAEAAKGFTGLCQWTTMTQRREEKKLVWRCISMKRTVNRKVYKICSYEVLLVSNQSVSCGVKSWVWEDHSSTVRHRSDRETSSVVQRFDFDGLALINFLVGSASHRTATVRVGTGSCRHSVASAGRIDGLRRHCVALRRVDVLCRQCVASRRVSIHWCWRSADCGGTTVCRFHRHGGESATCVIVIATINYELFVR